jgi:hypothetical protein
VIVVLTTWLRGGLPNGPHVLADCAGDAASATPSTAAPRRSIRPMVVPPSSLDDRSATDGEQ